jgi:hypothetical protein
VETQLHQILTIALAAAEAQVELEQLDQQAEDPSGIPGGRRSIKFNNWISSYLCSWRLAGGCGSVLLEVFAGVGSTTIGGGGGGWGTKWSN